MCANKKTMRSCLPDLPNKRDVNNHRIIKVSHYWTFLLWIWNSLVQKPHLRKMNTYHNQPLPKVWRIFWHSDIFSDVSMQYPFHHVCHEIGKISTAAPVWLWIKIECQRDWKNAKLSSNQTGNHSLSIPIQILAQRCENLLHRPRYFWATSPTTLCGVFQLPWRARRSFFYFEMKMAVFHLPLLVSR